MAMSFPYTERSAMVMVLLVPTFLLLNVPVMLWVSNTTSSEPTTPTNVAADASRSPSALVLALYTRFRPTMPVTVSSFGVTFA